MPGLTVGGVQTIAVVICCDDSDGLVLLQLFGEIYWYSTSSQYQTPSQDIAYGRSMSVKVLMEIVRGLLRTVKLVSPVYISLCAWVCACFCASLCLRTLRYSVEPVNLLSDPPC